jgi:hypothetical protein
MGGENSTRYLLYLVILLDTWMKVRLFKSKKQRLDDEIQQADTILQSKNVSYQ